MQELQRKRQSLLLSLVSSNDDEVRGKIKQLDELIRLPEDLQSEAVNLKQQF